MALGAAAGAGPGGIGGSGVVEQAASAPRIAAASPARQERVDRDMGLLLLEALGALALLIFIVWWTMFSGRKGGERRDADQDQDRDPKP